ncbi:hypothetical protein AC578_5294 [Pseudocercospora eumusae]|uniref:Uncharacterized protein n=1 Tax=Pseudocercospora eumusae TaxID=321146 RepID=A0A139GW88_9PEZI|nr:hypothetical protein AC578_5294 [Pseudocercospora eumusae]
MSTPSSSSARTSIAASPSRSPVKDEMSLVCNSPTPLSFGVYVVRSKFHTVPPIASKVADEEWLLERVAQDMERRHMASG